MAITKTKNVAVIGGGAAGFFTAINCAKKNPQYQVTIFEKSASVLSKVKVSGGGRCNVTHACFEPKELVKFYPRGEKQLLGPFTRFNPADTIEWFENRGVQLKTEEDGRMFPISDSSHTIVNCFLEECRKAGAQVKMQTGIDHFYRTENKWHLKTNKGQLLVFDAVVIATGSSAQIWKALETLGLKIIPPVPSLFTFTINNELLKGLSGISLPHSIIKLRQAESRKQLETSGPLLITHAGLSGPAILRLSAWGARALADLNYNFEISINWTGLDKASVLTTLKQTKSEHPKRNIITHPMFNIPKRLWERLAANTNYNYADISNQQLEQLVGHLTDTRLHVAGKATFKEEFVTAGGVDLNEIDFKTMESKTFPGLFFAGEVLDIDAITGGFNFQAAWTTAFIAANSV